MAVHEEPSGGEHVAPSPIACRSPCWRRGHLVTGEQHHHPGGAWFVLVTIGSPVRTSLTGAAMGSGPRWRRCSAGRSWIGWASQRAALTAAITATNVDDSTTFGAVLEDVPPIRTPSTTLARRGTRGSRRSRRMVSHSRARCRLGRRAVQAVGEEDQQRPGAHHQHGPQQHRP